MLLAMKRRAVERRGPRDIDDVAALIAILGFESADESEDLLSEFFPGEDLSTKTHGRVQKLLDAGLPPARPTIPPDWS